MAAGSHSTFGTEDPRICCICAGRIVISHPAALRFYHSKAGAFAWHVPCEQEHGWPVLRGAVDAA